ncbi:MAG: hypothetical protein OEV49_17690 [candidate division Zixibacteria bacterium]|nr:hypothetical protein [candidate division Zixibacteria bacterium]MDH3938033.1 hypothetical protein [candidate division Zixibacteria bacterium]
MRLKKIRLLWLLVLVSLLTAATSSAQLLLPAAFPSPDSGYLSNSAIDVITHGGGVWLITGEGLNATTDGGLTWSIHNSENGGPAPLVSSNMSAIYSAGSRLWVGSNHSEVLQERIFTLSDGVSYSDDNGQTWTQIDFSVIGQNIGSVWGGDRTVFDITGHEDWVFFTAFAGGFLASRDNGVNWRRIYASSLDSIQFNAGGQPSLRNRYFSCATDSSHGDTLVVWAGTADGVMEYIFAPPREKPHSKHINRVAFCDGCVDSSFVFFGGATGLTRGQVTGAPYISRFVEDGLPGPDISSVFDFRGRLLVGTIDPVLRAPTGLAASDDRGDSFYSITGFESDTISDFAALGERLYMAAQENGLVTSLDTGLTWERILIDSVTPSALHNMVNSVSAVMEIDGLLAVGTDTGLALLYFDPAGSIDSQEFHAFPEYDSTSQGDASSARIVTAKAQPLYTVESLDTLGNLDSVLDSLAIWTIHRPLTLEGRPIVGRHNIDSTRWLRLQVDVVTNDVNFMGDTAYVVGEAGMRFTTAGFNPGLFDGEIVDVEHRVNGILVDNLSDDVLTTLEVKGDTMILGTDNGFAVSLGATGESERKWRIQRVNTDSLAADAVVTHKPINTGGGLVGSFIPALAVQYVDDEYARIWVSNRHREFGDSVALSVGRVVPVDEDGNELSPDDIGLAVGFQRKWRALYRDDFAWNFAFDNSTVFAATGGGLVYNNDDTSTSWDTVAMTYNNGEPLLAYNAPVYGVAASSPYLWAGTDDRTVRFDLADFQNGQSFFVVDSLTPPDEVYAFPVPFSHTRDPIVDFHFVVESEGRITLEIYDFAMNLVARVIDNVSYLKGTYPASGTLRATWDGYNGKGEQVAVGVYYFKVEYSTGDVSWGKLAVIP